MKKRKFLLAPLIMVSYLSGGIQAFAQIDNPSFINEVSGYWKLDDPSMEPQPFFVSLQPKENKQVEVTIYSKSGMQSDVYSSFSAEDRGHHAMDIDGPNHTGYTLRFNPDSSGVANQINFIGDILGSNRTHILDRASEADVTSFIQTPATDLSVKVNINGETLSFDQPPVIIQDHTFVPLRGIFEKLGATVKYDSASSWVTATKGSSTIMLNQWGDAMINGKKTSLDPTPAIINNHMLVPLRVVSESLGVDVRWNSDLRTVEIQSNGSSSSSSTTSTDSTSSKSYLEHFANGYIDNEQLRLGTSKTQLINILGNPNKIGSSEGAETYTYGNKIYYLVDDKIVGIADISTSQSITLMQMKEQLGTPNREGHNDEWDEDFISYIAGPNEMYIGADKNGFVESTHLYDHHL